MFLSSSISSPAVRAFAGVSANGFIVFDRGFRIVTANKPALRLLDRPVHTILGQAIDDVIDGLDWSEPLWRECGERFGTNDHPSRLDRTGPVPAWHWSAHPIVAPTGTFDGGFCLHHPASSPSSAVEKRLRESERRLRDFVETASDWFWETDADLRYSYFSERYHEATGVAPETRLGRRRGTFRLDGPEDGDWTTHFADLEAHRPFRDFRFAYLDTSGQRRFAKVSGRPVFDDHGVFLGYRGVGRDITVEVESEQRIRFLAQHDPLTKLPNRAVLKDRLEQALLQAKRAQRSVSLLCVDLDDFKIVNDTFGHGTGDTLLCEAARRMREAARATDTVARVGGDEFTLIQVGATGWDEAQALATRLIASISQPFYINGEQLHCSTSIGISTFPDDGENATELLRHADVALYKAKTSGRNTYRFYTAEMNKEVQDRHQIERALRDAVNRESFCLHYQPQVDIATGRPAGCEALIRWMHPEKGLVSPGAFIQVAERSGLIFAIDRWVLRHACRQAKAWENAGLRTGRVAVNLSATQLRRGDIVDYLVDVLAESGLAPEQLEVEITESVLLVDTDTVVATLAAIDRLGVTLAIDDFGTGYSSLTYLRRFPVRKVKIDQSFVRNLLHNDDDKAIARAIVSLGHSLGLKVVAEGVETPQQFDFLRDIGCDEVQGYLIARPLPAVEFAALLSRLDAPSTDGRDDPLPTGSMLLPGSARSWLGHVIL